LPKIIKISPYLTKLQHAKLGAFYLRDAVSAILAIYGNVSGWVAGWLAVRRTPILYQNG